MYRSRKMISVYIDLALFIKVHVPSQESDQCVYRSCPFNYHFPGLVHILQWKGQDRYTHWSLSWLGTCTSIKRGKIDTHWSFLLKYMYQARKVISVYIDLALFIEVHVPSQESDQCVYRSCPFYWRICTDPGKGKIDIHTDHFPGLVHVLQ
jgi:hypothetical protein